VAKSLESKSSLQNQQNNLKDSKSDFITILNKIEFCNSKIIKKNKKKKIINYISRQLDS